MATSISKRLTSPLDPMAMNGPAPKGLEGAVRHPNV